MIFNEIHDPLKREQEGTNSFRELIQGTHSGNSFRGPNSFQESGSLPLIHSMLLLLKGLDSL
jgi:hypothetical protein